MSIHSIIRMRSTEPFLNAIYAEAMIELGTLVPPLLPQIWCVRWEISDQARFSWPTDALMEALDRPVCLSPLGGVQH